MESATPDPTRHHRDAPLVARHSRSILALPSAPVRDALPYPHSPPRSLAARASPRLRLRDRRAPPPSPRRLARAAVSAARYGLRLRGRLARTSADSARRRGLKLPPADASRRAPDSLAPPPTRHSQAVALRAPTRRHEWREGRESQMRSTGGEVTSSAGRPVLLPCGLAFQSQPPLLRAPSL